MSVKRIIGLIPARSGSLRVPDKNVFKLDGEPLICRAVRVAIESGIFSKVAVSTDSETYASLVKKEFKNEVIILLRPKEIATSTSPDIDWVIDCSNRLKFEKNFDAFAILRCSSPFRTAQSIKDCWTKFKSYEHTAHSIRAIEKVSKHPAKMWTQSNGFIQPLFPFKNGEVPWHSSQSNTLPDIYTQTASMEMAWVSTLNVYSSISGINILGFETPELEAFDINTMFDLTYASILCKEIGAEHKFN
ncbi:acylneuraminate cytidylyltransferase family protein [Paracoccaceae bacterium]|nr:acylneuraminate cytidylyltransferase family protein [Paracoccaceae bacterium]